MRLPVLLLLWPLLLALVVQAMSWLPIPHRSRWVNRSQVATAVGAVGAWWVWWQLTAVAPAASLPMPTTHAVTVADTTLALLPSGQALWQLIYGIVTLLFVVALIWPQGEQFVAGTLVALVPLALAQLVPLLPLQAFCLCGGLALLGLAAQAGRAEATSVVLRFVLMTLLALPLLLLSGWYGSSGEVAQLAMAARLLLLAILLLLGGFPVFVWVSRLVVDAPLGVTVLLLGVGQTAVFAFLFQLLLLNPALLADGTFGQLGRWCGVATALVGGVLALTAVDPRRLLGALLLLDIGFGLLTLTFPPTVGWETALALLLVRLLSLLLALVGLQLLEGDDNTTHLSGQGRRSPFALLLFVYSCLALLGLPLTVGFGGRWVILTGVVAAGGETAVSWQTILLLLATALGTYGLFRLLAPIFAPQPNGNATAQPAEPLWLRGLLTLLLLIGLWLAAFPQALLNYAHNLAALFG